MAHWKYRTAETELSWRFACAGEAIGFGAQSYDPDQHGGSAGDPDRRTVAWTDRGQGRRAAKIMRIDASLALVSAEDRALFEECYAPRCLPPIAAKASDEAAEEAASERRQSLTGWLTETVDGRHVCFVGALGRSKTAARAFAARGGRSTTVAEFLTRLSAQDRTLFRQVREELLALLNAALERYDAVRIPGPKREYDAKEDSQGDDRGLGAAPEYHDAAAQ